MFSYKLGIAQDVTSADVVLRSGDSTTNANDQEAEIDFLALNPQPSFGDGRWKKYEIPLASFTAANANLDLSKIKTYFEIRDIKNGNSNLTSGEHLFDEIYFDSNPAP